MKPQNAVVKKSIIRPEAYGLLFRREYEVKPGYGETGDVISVAGWFKSAEPRKAPARKPRTSKPARRKA